MNQISNDTGANKQGRNIHPADRREVTKTEFIDGKTITKPPANRWHNLISTNFIIAIGSRIQRNACELYSSDMPVRIGRNAVCFPDVAVACGEPIFADARAEILQNPILLIEIFSSHAKNADRTQKLEGFLSIPQLKECLLVNETEMRVEHYARQNPKQWIYRIYNERDDIITLESIHCKLSMAEVYAQVKFDDSELSSKAVN